MLRFKKEDGSAFPDLKEIVLADIMTERTTTQCISEDAPLLSFTIEQGVIDPSEKKTNKRDFLTKDMANKKYSLVEYNDIIYNPSNIIFGAINRNKFKRGVVSPIYAIFETSELPEYVELMVCNKRFINKSLKYLEGTVIKLRTLKPDDFLKLKVKLPCREEQAKVAKLFEYIDAKIKQQEKVVVECEELKKGMLQKLFDQEVRFKKEDGTNYPEWKTMNIDDACIVNPKTDNLDETFFYIDLESVNAGTLSLNDPINKEDAPSRAQRVLSVDDVLFQTVRPYQMNHFHYTEKFSMQTVASTGFAQMRLINGDNRFLYQLLYTNHFNQDVNIRCTGSNYPAINSSELLRIKIKLPCIEEQKKIADCLSAIDKKVETEKAILEDWKQMRLALLQQMFA